ncbi:hypothetical protein OESDEN_11387 [Oesophagostomum dentatum]|uniref:Uncharacterized protein n=1 Tax=Oesophagostomum dentatum TaxID=61180 RepID=A0A0B1SY19_OESDE|nr:hypothetical protein OESDEN_11387 [Oesophagostomum dentatum]
MEYVVTRKPKVLLCSFGPLNEHQEFSGLSEEYRKESEPKCDGDKVLIWDPLLGKKCSHEFCPDGADCIEGKWFAHCCGPKEKFGPKKFY